MWKYSKRPSSHRCLPSSLNSLLNPDKSRKEFHLNLFSQNQEKVNAFLPTFALRKFLTFSCCWILNHCPSLLLCSTSYFLLSWNIGSDDQNKAEMIKSSILAPTTHERSAVMIKIMLRWSNPRYLDHILLPPLLKNQQWWLKECWDYQYPTLSTWADIMGSLMKGWGSRDSVFGQSKLFWRGCSPNNDIYVW